MARNIQTARQGMKITNVARYSKRADAILAQAASADVIAIQEARTSMAAAFKAPAIARNFQRACKSVSSTKRRQPHNSGAAAYVATLSHHSMHEPGRKCSVASMLFDSGRWVGSIQETQNPRLTHAVFEEASRLGDQPVMVCTDLNYAVIRGWFTRS